MVNRLTLTATSNGGWVIYEDAEPHALAPMHAFTTTDDMMHGLANLVYPARDADGSYRVTWYEAVPGVTANGSFEARDRKAYERLLKGNS